MTKQYAERDPSELDEIGGYYFRHVIAMTKEDLHSKSQIACELGWRDMKIDELQQKLDAESLEKDYNADRLIYWKEHVRLLQHDFDAMAAENAALKEFGEKLNDMHNNLNGEGTGIQGRWEAACQQVALEAAIEEFDTIKTPATDAYLNSVRAEGLKMAIDHMNNQTSDDCADVTVLPVMEMYKKLTSGTYDNTHKGE